MEDSSNLRHRIFVYGTLKRGQPNYFHMEGGRHGQLQFAGNAVIDTAYPLVISTQWNLPFLLDAPGIGHQIFGEIYDIDDKFLEWLDEFEGHPDMYVREKVSVSLVSNDADVSKNYKSLGKTECWVYFLKKFPNQMLDLAMYSSYDAYGDHKKLYKPEEDELSSSNIEESLEN